MIFVSETLLIALISFAGTILGSLLGILTANKLTQYRIDKLEEAVNSIKDSTNKINELETHNQVQDEKIRQLEKKVNG